MEVQRPLMLGVVGDSAAGKTTLVRGVVRLLARDGVTPICLDDYYRYDRSQRARLGLTTGDPAATDFDLMLTHLTALAGGGAIRKPVYDHRSGVFRDHELVAATDLVIAYGMLSLLDPRVHTLFDLTLYLDPSEALRRTWRLDRDTSKRGYTPLEVESLAAARDRDAVRFVHGQRALADLVIRAIPLETGHVSYELLTRRTPALAALIPPLIDRLAQAPLAGLEVTPLIEDHDGRRSDRWLLAGDLPAATVAALQQMLRWLPEVPAPADLLRIGTYGERNDQQRSEVLAVVQQLIAYLLVLSRR